jgi:hypothetical protein
MGSMMYGGIAGMGMLLLWAASTTTRMMEHLVPAFHADTDPYWRKLLVAAIDSDVASPIILNTDEPVIAFGGFEGRDPAFSIERLAGLVAKAACASS